MQLLIYLLLRLLIPSFVAARNPATCWRHSNDEVFANVALLLDTQERFDVV